jgi:hypothetical protein
MNIKSILLGFITIALFFASCNNEARKENERLRAEINMLAEENAMLAEGNFDLARSVDTYHNMLREIDQQVAAIDGKHELIKKKTGEVVTDADVEEDILLHVEHMHHMMENSKHKIAHLSETMDDLRKENLEDHEQMHKMDIYIHDLATLVVKRDMEIEALHNSLKSKGMNNAALYSAYKKQKDYSDLLLYIINSAFYVAGTKKELKEMGILDMQGGFIGIGRVKTLNADAPVELFKPIDIRETRSITINGKKANLITPHPSDSYALNTLNEDKALALEITNNLKFWQETNFLVVEVVD